MIKQEKHTPFYTNRKGLERVTSLKFLGSNGSENLLWTTIKTAIVQKDQQLEKVNLSQQHLRSFYCCCIESMHTYDNLTWYGSSSAADRKVLQRLIKSSQRITNQQLWSQDSIFISRCSQKMKNICKDSYHPTNHLFHQLPSWKLLETFVKLIHFCRTNKN